MRQGAPADAVRAGVGPAGGPGLRHLRPPAHDRRGVLDIVAAVLAPLFALRLTAIQRTRSAQGPVVAAV
ncbi:hypothetical protein AW27_033900 (plasmid) [Streptomyces sp. PCS3-D2]|uniref:hypothetical protein n=1 Tax=Streptomyces sp. PCS3-D2 TaxID=1460244 RepID=UPI00272B3FE9|nr:hypothetical protein [Streptomyces sp. PCS3-D2]WKV76550.1 hypothetical protein AW27_033900 [Streptomyces sp. PCS3-D2]